MEPLTCCELVIGGTGRRSGLVPFRPCSSRKRQEHCQPATGGCPMSGRPSSFKKSSTSFDQSAAARRTVRRTPLSDGGVGTSIAGMVQAGPVF